MIDTADLRFLACREAAHIASSLIFAADEIDRLRAKLKEADEEVWRLVRDEYIWVSETRNLRRILDD